MKLSLPKSLVAFAFAMAPLFLFAQIQEEEPNDEYIQAQVVSPNETINASWSIPFEWDLFTFTLTEPGKISCDIVDAGLEPLSLAIVNQTSPGQTVGQLVEELNVSDPQFHIEKCCLAQGQYAIRLRAPSTADNTPYTVELTFTPYDGPNDEASHMSNQDFESAVPIELNDEFIVNGINGFDDFQAGLSRDRVDWFTFEMPSRGEIFIDSLVSSAEYDATCAAFNVNDPFMRFLMPGPNNLGQLTSDGHFECLSAGTHYISFEGPGDENINEYCVSYSLFGEQVLFEEGDDGSNDFEDDTFETARTYVFNNDGPKKGYLGHIRYTGALSADQTDWWSFTTEASGPFTITLENEGLGVGVAFFAPNGNNTPFSFASQTAPGFRTYVFPCVEEGQEILMRLIQSVGDPCGEYFIEAFSGNADFQSDDSDNDTFESAQSISVDSTIDVAIGHERYDEEYDDVDDLVDYFKVELENGELRVNIDLLTGEAPELGLFVEDLNADDEITMHRVAISEDDFDEENLIYTWSCLASGDYFLVIEPSGNNECSTFTMNLTNFGELAQDQEPNEEVPNVLNDDGATGAIGFPKGFIEDDGFTFLENDNLDAWSYEMENPGNLTVNVTSEDSGNPLILDLRVFNSDGLDITSFGVFQETPNNQTEWLLTCVDNGTFTIELGLDALSPCGLYTISCSGEDAMAGADNDNNDSFETAQGIDVGGFEQGSLGFRDDLDLEEIDFVDFYAFDWEGGDIQIGVSSDENFLPELNLFFNDNGIPRSIEPTFSEDGELPGEHLKIYTFECWGEGNYVLELNSANVNGYDCRGYGLSVYTPVNNNESEQENGSPLQMNADQVEGTIGYQFFSDGIVQLDSQDVWYKVVPPSRKVSVQLNLNFEHSQDFGITAGSSSDGSEPIEPNDYAQEGESFALDFECYANDTLFLFINSGGACGGYQLVAEVAEEFTFEDDEEPNNIDLEAILIYSGETAEGTLRSRTILNNQFQEVTDTQDFYSFSITELTDSIHVKLTTDVPGEHFSSRAKITLYKVTLEGIIQLDPCYIQGLSTDQSRIDHFCCLEPADYLISVNEFSNEYGCLSYRLELDINDASGIVDQHTSPEDAPIPLQNGVAHRDVLGVSYDGIVDDSDTFIFDLPVGKALDITMSTTTLITAQLVYLGNPLEDQEIWSVFVDGAAEQRVDCYRPGQYKLEINRLNNSCEIYQVQYSYLDINDSNENNNTQAQATLMNEGDFISAAVGHAISSSERDNLDYYAFALPTNTRATITMNSIPDELGGSPQFTADLMRGANILSTQTSTTTAELESTPFSEETQLYVRVTNLFCGEYTIELSFSPGLVADLNGDGAVDSSDLIEFLGSFPCAQDCGPADFNGDGIINAGDLMIFLTNFQG